MTTEQENELIREKLLNLKPFDSDRCANDRGFLVPMPHFTDWQSAGLILDALSDNQRTISLYISKDATKACIEAVSFGADLSAIGKTGPLAIRAAALEYMKHANKI